MERVNPFEELEGKKFYHVTSLLNIIRKDSLERWRGRVGNFAADEEMRIGGEYGTEFHKYGFEINRGEGHLIDTDKLEMSMKLKVEWYKNWFFENVEKVLICETLIYSRKHLFCGSPDFVAILKGHKTPAVLDFKTSSMLDKSVRYQTSAYKEGIKEDLNITTGNRIILHMPRKSCNPQDYHAIYLDKSTHESDFMGFIYFKEGYKNWNQK